MAKKTKQDNCNYPNCKEKHHCKGFCKYHYCQFRKGWLSSTGEKLESWKGSVNHEVEHCLVKGQACFRPPSKRGFCNKHYKWLAKGQCAPDGTVIKKPNLKQKYNILSKCKVEDCKNRPKTRHFCSAHYREFLNKKRNGSGEILDSYRVKRRKYSKDWKCVKCGKKGEKYVLGFCKDDYEQYRKGFIDFQGRPTRKKKLRTTYAKGQTCKVTTCRKPPRCVGFCENHHIQFKRGLVDNIGNWTKKKKFTVNNKGKKCAVITCKEGATCKGYCRKHYTRWKNTGVAHDKGRGLHKTCTYPGCNLKHSARGLCSKHYFRKKKGYHLDDKYNTKISICEIQGCSKKHAAKGFCGVHYYRLMHDLPMEGMPVCAVKGCKIKIVKKNNTFCAKHSKLVTKG